MRLTETVALSILIHVYVEMELMLFSSASDINDEPEDIVQLLDEEDRRIVERYRAEEMNRPHSCSALCPSTVAENEFGLTIWPNSSVGIRHMQRCPYTNDYRLEFASRDCVPIRDTGLVGWTDVNNTGCDLLPIFAAVARLQTDQEKSNYGEWLKESIERLVQLFLEASSFSLSPSGAEVDFAFEVGYLATNDYQFFSSDVPVTHILDLFAVLFSREVSLFLRHHNHKNVLFHINRVFNNLPAMLREAKINETVRSSSMSDQSQSTRLLSYNIDTIEEEFNFPWFYLDTDYGLMMFKFILCDGCSRYQVGVLVLFAEVLADVAEWLSDPEDPSNQTSVLPRLFPRFIQVEVIGAAEDNGQFRELSLVEIEFHAPQRYPEDGSNASFSESSCAWNTAEGGFYDLGYWKTSTADDSPSTPCQMTFNDSIKVVCLCQGSGYFGLKTIFNDMVEMNQQSYIRGNNGSDVSTLGVFLGFSYRTEMWILGMVLQSISLGVLTATVVTFAAFKKARRGRSTGLLTNLCAALICLNVVLLVAPLVSSSRLGCTVSNILRYYFIMVSLLWNGAEAYNIFFMVLNVLDPEVAGFVIKAAVVAWGLPVLVIGGIIFADSDALSGFYENCIFRCALPSDVLLYAYVVPLSVIIIHNFFVFCLVMRLLHKRKEQNGDDSRTSDWSQVAQGVTLLVLLGLPWIFSAFGALDINQDNRHLDLTETVLHILFLVGVNLQGIFIFFSQCLLRPHIRILWSSAMGSSSTQTAAVTQTS